MRSETRRLFSSMNVRALIVSAIGLGAIVFGRPAHAGVLVQDSFSIVGQESLQNLSTDPSAPTPGLPTSSNPSGPTYQGTGQADGYNTGEYTGNLFSPFSSGTIPQGQVDNGTGAAITLGGTTATALEMTMTFAQAANPTAPLTSGYSIFGYYSAVPASHYSSSIDANFSGLAVDTDGNLYSDVNGTLGAPVAYGGTYNVGTLNTLTYDVDTTTGDISNVSFGSSTSDYSALGSLGALTPNYAGFAASFYGPSQPVTVLTNFEVSTVAVPEPASLGMLVLGSSALSFRRRRQA
jgi:hypothetical protein